MAKKSGISVELITKIGGILKGSIRKLGGKITADLGFGPDYNAASCTTVFYGYADGDRDAPESACTAGDWDAFIRPYEWDAVNGILYTGGDCGVNIARPGYYSDGTTIYSWDGRAAFEEYGSCTPSFPLISNTTLTLTNATNGYPLSQCYMTTTVDSRANPNNAFYIYYTDQSTDSGVTWARVTTYLPAFNMNDKTRMPDYIGGTGAFIAQVQEPNPGNAPAASLFNNELYRVTGYPIFNDPTSYVQVIIDAGNLVTDPAVVSIQSYYQGTPYY